MLDRVRVRVRDWGLGVLAMLGLSITIGESKGLILGSIAAPLDRSGVASFHIFDIVAEIDTLLVVVVVGSSSSSL